MRDGMELIRQGYYTFNLEFRWLITITVILKKEEEGERSSFTIRILRQEIGRRWSWNPCSYDSEAWRRLGVEL
jgi:hypothetical protein